ncbi:hypothetical protein [Tahibacter harae]|uniref:Secreted protein with PEP-CTERM sorting signal n=1 Tax=Tahibacter harae TaxID=2963937 RepID=A0ABT1QWW2_9GAMM|nr:hypothetical protein [Tahibacter harae]MCQ4166777.1 hypothetical protein [Tahibacter harae]
MDDEKTRARETAAARARGLRTLLLMPSCALGMGYLGKKMLPFFSADLGSRRHGKASLPAPWEILVVVLMALLGAYLGYWLARAGRRR